MKDIHKFEALVASWYRGAPHLSQANQVWLAKNVWWLALIGVILGAIGVFGVLGVTLITGVVLVAVGGVYGAILSSAILIAVLLFLALAITCLILTALAISPLRAGRKKGWTLLFVVALINVIALALNFFTTFDFFSLIWGLLMTILGGYFLFEIRSHFVGVNGTKNKSRH